MIATLIIIVGGGIPLSIAALETNGIDVPGVRAPASIMAMLDQRSPGERTAAELTKSKRKMAQAPRQRALGKIVKPEERTLPKSFVDAISPPAPVISPVAPPVGVAAAEAPLAAPVKAGLVPFGLAPPPGGGIFSPPGGGGGGDNPPPPPPPGPDTPPPVLPAIPEPSTWAMMLLGFGMTGWIMRRQRGRPARAFA